MGEEKEGRRREETGRGKSMWYSLPRARVCTGLLGVFSHVTIAMATRDDVIFSTFMRGD